jgi:hypothetical protein
MTTSAEHWHELPLTKIRCTRLLVVVPLMGMVVYWMAVTHVQASDRFRILLPSLILGIFTGLAIIPLTWAEVLVRRKDRRVATLFFTSLLMGAFTQAWFLLIDVTITHVMALLSWSIDFFHPHLFRFNYSIATQFRTIAWSPSLPILLLVPISVPILGTFFLRMLKAPILVQLLMVGSVMALFAASGNQPAWYIPQNDLAGFTKGVGLATGISLPIVLHAIDRYFAYRLRRERELAEELLQWDVSGDYREDEDLDLEV